MIADRAAVLRFRVTANHLDERLPAGSLAKAAFLGLQDSAPWSGLLSLHARVAGVPAGAWEDPELAQVFGPRGAIYLVPRADLAVFTLGQLPRDPARVAEIEADADRLGEMLSRGTQPRNDRRARWAGATGRLLVRWDTRTTVVASVAPPAADPEECRRELARRFLHATGPATVAQLQWFTDGSRADADATLRALGRELVPVEVGGEARWMLAADVEALARAGQASGVRLVPPDDPLVSRVDKALVAPDTARRAEVWPKAPPPGVVLVDGELAGTWRRRGSLVTVTPWRDLPEAEVVEEAAAMPFAGGAEVRWA